MLALTARAASGAGFTIAPIPPIEITQASGKVSVSFTADITMSGVSSYQFLLTIGSIEGNCQKNPNVDINQTIQNVISPAVIKYQTPNSCGDGQFNFSTESNACREIRHHIKPRFTFTVDAAKLKSLQHKDKLNWQSLHLSIREPNSPKHCASQPLLISEKSNAQIQISGLYDVELTEERKRNFRQDESFCVFVTDAGQYQLTGNGGPADNMPFLLRNGEHTMPYIPRLITSNQRPVRLRPGTPVRNLIGSDSLNCNAGSNALIRVLLKKTEAAQQPPGVYTGTLFLTVELQ
ncbi:hypothetical protein [uncultured Endozoicomonas sp.]|uniref:hypothetical protein n=1 Tax=uncultured Endozoicomonas sp. TaxID=432652 RepID=UPI002630F70A|nr:hypothetical protein [uncultured Endozoicomonas sp.]